MYKIGIIYGWLDVLEYDGVILGCMYGLVFCWFG